MLRFRVVQISRYHGRWRTFRQCALELCDIFVERAAKLHLVFDVNWQIHIHSPSSGEHTIAFCDLR